MAKTLRLILGDQLNIQHSWYQEVDDTVRYLMMEMRQETDYVRHHIQKIVGFFLSMRTFAEALKKAGHQVIYLKLDDPKNQQTLKGQLNFLISNEGFERFEYQLPDEYRLDQISIAQVEGFIRQIIGWREYMRGIYWAKMPEFAELNFFGHDRKLPEWFWTGKTKMNCLSQAIGQSLDLAYAHHIQRLMVTGNFALLAGIHPDEVDQWYLGIYIDAIQWVEITNTRGMSQFADGGIVGTKPYVSTANYIKKQGNYCEKCAYNSNKKTGIGACPFNSLYWHFYDRNRNKLERNPRIGMAFRTWDKMTNKEDLLKQAEQYLEQLDQL
jgi:deoxyribodipyrimidine photolyase-like uncharacterized protein